MTVNLFIPFDAKFNNEPRAKLLRIYTGHIKSENNQESPKLKQKYRIEININRNRSLFFRVFFSPIFN